MSHIIHNINYHYRKYVYNTHIVGEERNKNTTDRDAQTDRQRDAMICYGTTRP